MIYAEVDCTCLACEAIRATPEPTPDARAYGHDADAPALTCRRCGRWIVPVMDDGLIVAWEHLAPEDGGGWP